MPNFEWIVDRKFSLTVIKEPTIKPLKFYHSNQLLLFSVVNRLGAKTMTFVEWREKKIMNDGKLYGMMIDIRYWNIRMYLFSLKSKPTIIYLRRSCDCCDYICFEKWIHFCAQLNHIHVAFINGDKLRSGTGMSN